MQDGLSGDDGAEHLFPSMLKQLTEFRKPLIAAVNGLGVGIGMTFLAHCDLVLMSTSARLRTPFPQLGLAPEAGSSYTFPTRMGWQKERIRFDVRSLVLRRGVSRNGFGLESL